MRSIGAELVHALMQPFVIIDSLEGEQKDRVIFEAIKIKI